MSVDMKDHPLYDLATEQAVAMTPPNLTKNTVFPLMLVQELMTLMWLQGLTWGVTHPQEAVTSTMNLGQRRREEDPSQDNQEGHS